MVAGVPADGCSALSLLCSLPGKVVLLQRGNCTYETKASSTDLSTTVAIALPRDMHSLCLELFLLYPPFAGVLADGCSALSMPSSLPQKVVLLWEGQLYKPEQLQGKQYQLAVASPCLPLSLHPAV